MNWVIFGAGNFIGDIFDAVLANGDTISSIVLNQKIDSTVLQNIPRNIRTIQLQSFRPDKKSQYLFGFLSPEKASLLTQLKKYKLTFSNLVHPTAYLAYSTKLGQGNFVGAQSVIGPHTTLGNFNYINRSVSLGHNVSVKNFNRFSPGVTICGRCRIGSNNYFGAGSTVIDGITVDKKVMLGAGGALVENPHGAGTYIGVPAKKRV